MMMHDGQSMFVLGSLVDKPNEPKSTAFEYQFGNTGLFSEIRQLEQTKQIKQTKVH